MCNENIVKMTKYCWFQLALLLIRKKLVGFQAFSSNPPACWPKIKQKNWWSVNKPKTPFLIALIMLCISLDCRALLINRHNCVQFLGGEIGTFKKHTYTQKIVFTE